MDHFGTVMRRERKDRGMTLGDLARGIGLSVPYLSQIETGAKPIQDALVEKIIRVLGLIGNSANELRRAAALSSSEYAIRLQDCASDDDRMLASAVASGFARLSADRKAELRRIMEDNNRG